MKLTKSFIKQVIKEELEKIHEMDMEYNQEHGFAYKLQDMFPNLGVTLVMHDGSVVAEINEEDLQAVQQSFSVTETNKPNLYVVKPGKRF